MAGIDDLVQVWRELFERTRRTQKSTPQRSLSIIKTVKDPVELDEALSLDVTQPPAAPQWADPPTWSSTTNTTWSGGAKWGA